MKWTHSRRRLLVTLLLITLTFSLFFGQISLAQTITYKPGTGYVAKAISSSQREAERFPACGGQYYIHQGQIAAINLEDDDDPTHGPGNNPNPVPDPDDLVVVPTNPEPTDPEPTTPPTEPDYYAALNCVYQSTNGTVFFTKYYSFSLSVPQDTISTAPYVADIEGYTFESAFTPTIITLKGGSNVTVTFFYSKNSTTTTPTTPAVPQPTQPPVNPKPTQPTQPPQPTQPIWDSMPTVPFGDEGEEDWNPTADDEKSRAMILHILDSNSFEPIQTDMIIYDLSVGVEVKRDVIAPDIPGYILDTDNTRQVFIQNDGITEDALYYYPDIFDYIPEPDDILDGEDMPGDENTEDSLCPDCPGSESGTDPNSPWSISNPPTGPCSACKKGTLCEQMAVGKCDPLPGQHFVKPNDSNAFPKASPTQKAGKLSSVNWDQQYDVIVYGFDLAGAVTALTAAEQGAKVILIDRAPAKDAGGYTRDTAQNLIFAKDKAEFRKFVAAWNEGYEHVDATILDTYANGAERLPYWLKEHGANPYLMPRVQYDELEGSAGAGLLRLSEKASYDRAVWKLVLQALKPFENKQIFFMSESQITELLQDPKTKTVVGVKVHSDKLKKDFNFRAKGGVVLAGGGFENNEEMIEDYLLMPQVISKYAKWDNGDAIKLAMRAGADLWHMGNVSGYELHLKNPTKNLQYRNPLQGLKQYQLGGRACFVVGPDGRRFTDEGALVRSGHVYQNDEWRIQQLPQEAWAILDQEGLTKMPLAQYFSEDNLQEVADGKILTANDLTALAQLLKIDPEALEQQFMDYQEFCAQAYDPQCGRRAENLFALDEEGPYYAVPLAPVLEATLGGPKRNASCEILDTQGEIISHLFGAGSLGSILPNIFPQGADLTEAIVSGQIAGANAAGLAKGK